MKISIAIHLVGIVFWIGGVLLLPRIMKALVDAPQAAAALAPALKKVFFGFIVPGIVMVILTGVFQFFVGGGFGLYMKQGWFHGKLTFVILLLVATALLFGEVSKVISGGSPSRAKLGAIHGITALSLVAIVFLTIIGR